MFCLSRQASPLAASPHARRSREISATGCGYPKPAGWFSSSQVVAPPSPQFAGDDATVRGSPTPFAGDDAAVRGSPSPPFAGDDAAVRGSPRPTVHGRSRCRPASDSKPARSPLTQARRPPQTLALWIQSTRHGQESRVCVLWCRQENFNQVLSVLSTETPLGRAAPLVVAAEAILAACPLVMEAVAEGPCEGPWCHVMPRRSLSFRA